MPPADAGAGSTAAPGSPWCRERTATVDAALRGWLADLQPRMGVAVVALGGYARRELCPGSDVDVLLLHDGWPRPDLERLVQALCYPLWDAGLSVGHAVRTAGETVRAAGERTDTACALIDRRLVAGDAGLADDLSSRLARWLQRRGGRLLADLADADRSRRAGGGHPGMLEPDLKNGVGGLRDLHSLRWAAACVLGEAGLDPLVGARHLGAVERRDLAEAGERLLAARCALHLAHGRRRPGSGADTLRLDLQDDVAERLGLDGADELLRGVGLAARTVAHLHGRAWPRLLADARGGRRRRRGAPERLDVGVTLADGLVELDAASGLADDPSLGLRALAGAGAAGTHLSRAAAARLRRELDALRARRGADAGGPLLRWDERSRQALLAALRQGGRALPAFADADQLGLLAAHLPEWPRVRGRPQRNPLHRYDLDTHSFAATAELAGVAAGEVSAEHAELWAGLADQDALLLATWLHDVGKAWPGDHSVAGARVARDWVLQMGFPARRADRVARLVRLHLLLPDVATRRDLDDDDELVGVAERVGDPDTLDGLYLLSLADARATGPAAHSGWKDGLIAELHARVRRILRDDAGPVLPSADPVATVAEARRRLDASDGQGRPGPLVVDALLVGLPRRYLLAVTPEQLVEHALLLQPLPDPGQLRARWRAGPAAGTSTVSVVSADRRGLMADCAGVLAAHDLPVLDARAHTRGDGVALDWFVVGCDFAALGEQARRAVVRDLQAAGGGRLDVSAAVAARERRGERRRPPAPPLEVRFERGPVLWRLEVSCHDSPGILYRIARTLADAGLDVVGAKVATTGAHVRDVFFVRPVGGPPDGRALAERLGAAVAGPAAGGAAAHRGAPGLAVSRPGRRAASRTDR